MLQVRRDADLAQKSLGAEHRAQLRIENLERDAPIVLDVASQVYGRHPAATNFTVEEVGGSEGALQLIGNCGHAKG